MSEEQRGRFASWRAVLLVVVPAALIGCSGDEAGAARPSEGQAFNDPRSEATTTLSADAAELWEGTWYETSSTSLEDNVYFMMEIFGADEVGFEYEAEYRDIPYGPNAIRSAAHNARFDGPGRAVDPATGHVFLLTVDPADRGARAIDVVEGDPGSLGWSPAAGTGPETLEGRWIFHGSRLP